MKKEDQEQLNFSRKILEQLIMIAEEVLYNYVSLNVDNVSLSAKEVINYIDYCKIMFKDNVPEYTVTEGSFSCKFDGKNIFLLVEKFEKLAKIKKSEKKLFIIGNGIEKKICTKTYFIDEKTGKTVCRKRTLNQVTENLAIVSKGFNNLYYVLIDDIWYFFHEGSEVLRNKFAESDNLYSMIYRPLKSWNYPEGNKYNDIFKVLFDALSKKIDIQDTKVNEISNPETSIKNQDTTKDTKVSENEITVKTYCYGISGNTVSNVSTLNQVTENLATVTKGSEVEFYVLVDNVGYLFWISSKDSYTYDKIYKKLVNAENLYGYILNHLKRFGYPEICQKDNLYKLMFDALSKKIGNQDTTKDTKVVLKPTVAVASFPSVVVHGTLSTDNVCSVSELKQTYLCKLPVKKLPELQLSG